VERIGIKWRDVDVSVFRSLPRSPENCHFIIEAKTRSRSRRCVAPGKGLP
jgi:hypothetical protein